MKYMLLIYNSPSTLQALSPAENDAMMAEIDGIMAELDRNGELVGGDALAPATDAKTVRFRDGVPATTDGPFVEAKEQFAGYLMVDVATQERALEIAARWPDARFGAMEVRAILDTVSTPE